MKTTTLSIIALIAGMTFVSVAHLSEADAARADRRQRHQKSRIRQGVRSGVLTRDEASGLRKDVRENRKSIREARQDDGRLDREERREIRKDQNQTSKNIYQEKHD
jgi:hypothetical protein